MQDMNTVQQNRHYWGDLTNPVVRVRTGSKLNLGEYSVWLTSREIQCVLFLMQGKSAKETARLMNISHRTVEGYIDTIKVKLGCRTKLELLSLAYMSELVKQLQAASN